MTSESPVEPAAIAPLSPTPVYDTLWRFAAERQRVFYRRLEGLPAPWTDDPVLRTYKFTNAYRASDRVSQFLIRRVIYRGDLPDDPTEVVFRILLFKVFNRIETWELLEQELGLLTYSDYVLDRVESLLSRALARGESIYSAAYIMPPGKSHGRHGKHRHHLLLIDQMVRDELPKRLAECESMANAFEEIRRYPTIGSFLGYQFITDVNYSAVTAFNEMDFVVPGPGAVDGIRKCFTDTSGLSDSDVIRLVAERQEAEFERLGLNFRTLWGRRLQLVDCQNLFCEVAKYSRVAHPEIADPSGRKRIKQHFRPNATPIHYWYPPDWNINDAASVTQNDAAVQ